MNTMLPYHLRELFLEKELSERMTGDLHDLWYEYRMLRRRWSLNVIVDNWRATLYDTFYRVNFFYKFSQIFNIFHPYLEHQHMVTATRAQVTNFRELF